MDTQKIFDAIKCVQKTLQCTLCKKLPTDASAPKCGHPFCGSCIEKILHSKKAVCSICKTVVIRSNVYKIRDIDRTIKDLETLANAIVRDSGADRKSSILLDSRRFINADRSADDVQTVRQYGRKRPSIKAQPSTSKEDVSPGTTLMQKPRRTHRQSSEVNKSARTLKIERKISKSKNDEPDNARASTSKASNSESGIFDRATEKIPADVRAIEPNEKVDRWLSSGQFDSGSPVGGDFPEITQQHVATNPMEIGEKLETFSQTRSNSSSTSLKNRSKSPLLGNKSQVSKDSIKKIQDDESGTNSSLKFKSFTFEMKNKSQNPNPKAVTPAEKMFDELCVKKTESKKSTSTEGSWSELARFRKETRPKIKKRKRLNISIGKPDTARQMIESEEDSKEEQNLEPADCSDGDTGRKNTISIAETDVEQQFVAEKIMPTIVSSRRLEKEEMIKISTLNKREVKEIIGAALTESDLERSLNSNILPDKLSLKSTKEKLSLRKSNEYDRDTSNESVPGNDPEKKRRSYSLDNVRPQSKQSFNLSNSRPNSRLSTKSPARLGAEKFQLSMKRQSLTPNTSPANISPQRETRVEKIVFSKESPVRSCNDFLRNKLTLGKSSCDGDKKRVSIQKLGKLFKSRNRIKFLHLGPIKSRLDANEVRNTTTTISTHDAQTQTSLGLINTPLFPNDKITLSDAQTQTSPGLDNANYTTGNRHKKLVSNKSLSDAQIPGTRSSSVTLSGFEKMESLRDSNISNAGRATGSLKSKEVNMLSPGKDSQLKYLETESPSSGMVGFPDGNHATEETEASFKPERGNGSSSFLDGIFRQESGRYMEEVKMYADKLIVTDSEDQEKPNESFGRNKRKNDYKADVSSSNKETFANIASTSKMHGQINTAGSQRSINSNKPPLINAERKLSYVSPTRKKLSRDSVNSQKKKKSLTKASGSNHVDCYASDAETILLRKKTNENGTQYLENSETSIISSKHKVVRKLQYSQESSPSSNVTPVKAGPSSPKVAFEKQRKADDSSVKKTFQRIRSVSSTDSDSELMEISLTTKPSESTSSQKTLRLRPSQTTSKGLLHDEEMSVEFSSNRDSPELKKKRSLSESSLDRVDLQAIATDWCADLDRSSEEIAIESARVLGVRSGHVVKKPKFEIRDSSASYTSDSFPPLNVNTEYQIETKITKSHSNLDKEKNHNSVDSIEKMQKSRPSSPAKLISDKNKESSLAIHVGSNYSSNDRAKNSILRNNSRCGTLSGNIELGDTSNSVVNPVRNLTPVKSRTSQLSHNSDKENEMNSSEAKSWVEKRETISRNVGKKILSSEDLSDFVTVANVATSNNASLSRKETSPNVAIPFDSCSDQDFLNITQGQTLVKEVDDNSVGRNSSNANKKNIQMKMKPASADNITPFETCSDQDFLNITQEQIQLQEIEDNLLGRNSRGANKKNEQIKTAEKLIENYAEVTLRAEKPSTNKVAGQTGRSDAIIQPDSDDSVTINEDIIETTPQKNLPPKKDLQNHADCSQRSTMSRKSFMSVDMTPIPKTFAKHLRRSSEIFPLAERNSPRISVQKRSSFSTGSIHPSCHSTPKPCTSMEQRVNPLVKLPETEKKKDKFCFISSCLTPIEVNNVKKFARVNGAEFTVNYKPEVTHVIVKANESNSASKTLKYLLGIAHKKWIVSYRWVTDSMAQGRLLEEEKYEVVDSDMLEPGAKRSRLSKRGLFEDFAFICMNPIRDITASQIEDLLISTGGIIAQSLKELVSATRKYKIYLYNSDINDAKKLRNLRQEGGVLPVPFEWVLTCISQYELASLYSYIEPEDRELASDLQFPPELLLKIDESYSGNEEPGSDVDQ